MTRNFLLLKNEIIDQALCTRCGLCVGVCPVAALSLTSDNFPYLRGSCIACGSCFTCCPGAEVDFPALSTALFDRPYNPTALQGHVENTYVGHAAQKQIRQQGSGGGLITALLCFLLEKKKIDGALVVGSDPLKPYRSKAILTSSPEVLLQASQAKYGLNASLASLRELHKCEGKFAVTALPCQVHALRKLPQGAPKLAAKIELILGLHCSCGLEFQALLDMLKAKKIHKGEVERLCFRGPAWPGAVVAEKRDGCKIPLYPSEAHSTVHQLLGGLYGAERCLVCMDGLAEYADLSFGDFSAAEYTDGKLNTLTQCTLVCQRTSKGLELLKEAERAGSLILHRLPAAHFPKQTLALSQAKRQRTAVYAVERKRKRLPNPNYHISLPKPGFKEKKSTCSYLLLDIFRHHKAWRLFLIKLFLNSHIGLILHRLNRVGKRLLGDRKNN